MVEYVVSVDLNPHRTLPFLPEWDEFLPTAGRTLFRVFIGIKVLKIEKTHATQFSHIGVIVTGDLKVY